MSKHLGKTRRGKPWIDEGKIPKKEDQYLSGKEAPPLLMEKMGIILAKNKSKLPPKKRD